MENSAELRSIQSTLIRVEDALALLSPKLIPMRVENAVDGMLQIKGQKDLRHRYLLSLSSALNIFCRSFGNRLLHEIQVNEIDAWLSNPNWKGETRRGYLSRVRTLYSFGMKRSWCMRNIAELVDWPQPETTAPGVLNLIQIRTLLELALRTDPALASFCAVQIFGGLRVSEAIGLQSADFINSHVNVRADNCKTRKRRLVPMNPALDAWCNPNHFPIVNWRKRLDLLKSSCGFEWPHNCLRHSFVTYSVPVNGARDTALWAGHSESVLFNHYRALVTSGEALKFWLIMPPGMRQMELIL